MARGGGPVGQATGFLGYLVRHWILTVVFLVVVVLFLARPISNILARVPFLNRWTGGGEE